MLPISEKDFAALLNKLYNDHKNRIIIMIELEKEEK